MPQLLQRIKEAGFDVEAMQRMLAQQTPTGSSSGFALTGSQNGLPQHIKPYFEVKNFDRVDKFDGIVDKFKTWLFDFKVAISMTRPGCEQALDAILSHRDLPIQPSTEDSVAESDNVCGMLRNWLGSVLVGSAVMNDYDKCLF